MLNTFSSLLGRRFSHSLWDSTIPVREELFGLERLEEHAESLAKAQQAFGSEPSVLPLQTRLDENATALLASYRESAVELERGGSVVPAAEWLLDNYHLVEEQIREIRDDLPDSYYRQLPKLADGPFAGYPRVFGLTWAFVAHTDSHIDPDVLVRFIHAYQKVQPLTIGELWAVAITLRIVLIENLRRLADQIAVGRDARHDADHFTERLLVAGCAHSALQEDIASRSPEPLSEVFAAQLAKRLRDQDPKTTPALDWLEQRLQLQGLSVEEVVQHAQQRQGASNVTIRNVITSMRLISDIDWSELFEKVSLVDQEFYRYNLFAQMDFPTRNLYRSAVEELARGCDYSEIDIAQRAVEMAKDSLALLELKSVESTHAEATETLMEEAKVEINRFGDPGYYLIEQGRLAFEKSIAYKPTMRLRVRRFHVRLGVAGYSGTIAIVALAFLTMSIFFAGFMAFPAQSWLLWAVVAFIPATEVAFAIVNRLVTWRFGAVMLPGLELKAGVPTSLRTLIAVPTLLTSEADLLEQIERLEVHYLSGIDGDVSFALLTDGKDADLEELESDALLLERATLEIERLNQRYEEGPSGPRFILLHRRRLFNPSENVWMGWERKRGKLHELNRLLRGATNTTFMAIQGKAPSVPSDVRYVITLDADTRLPREAALRLIGKMAHPLNRPRLDKVKQRVVAGYGILQPRVTPSLSVGTEGSLFQRIFSAPGGMDPYAAAISDVYQDLFGEGSFTGKGIYDVDMFEAALADRVPNDTMLSHDLFEGIFARAGLVSDVEVVEEFPARYDAAAKRQHRWMRGDWQLLPWIMSKPTEQGVSSLGRWKLLDNLRRSLVAPTTLLALVLSWLLFPSSALFFTDVLLAVMAIPPLLPCVFSMIPRRSGVDTSNHFRLWLGDLRLALSQTFLSIAFLPDQSWRSLDAITRTLLRLGVTHRRCLEWATAAQSNASPRLKVVGFYQNMACGTLLALAVCLFVIVVNPAVWLLVLPFALLWSLAPLVAVFVSRSPEVMRPDELDVGAVTLRLTARKTWRYFETFVTEEDNFLPPDNFQEDPEPVVAHRTSPTNIGLYLLSSVAARDFGWAGLIETIERLETTFVTLEKLPKHNGHFFNWYGTQSLHTLLPEYISSVDSGNLAGHLIALANSCEQWHEESAIGVSHGQSQELSQDTLTAKLYSTVRSGFMDNIVLARQSLVAESKQAIHSVSPDLSVTATDSEHPLLATLDDMESRLNSRLTIEALTPILIRLTDKAAKLARERPLGSGEDIAQGRHADFIYWIEAANKVMVEQQRDTLEQRNSPNSLLARLNALASTARNMALDMDFAFLIDPERKLLSIGYSLAENSLDPSCYDLLASEARLASLFAIAKGDVATKHWFRLGRAATPMGNGSALISWSGSMFEYLMPSLIMRAPTGSLLEQTNRLIVERQQEYGKQLGIPWGVSESSYNARDIEFTYQYSNFGVPGLGLKRGLAENRVIAPYATGLATMIDPQAAVDNYERLNRMGAGGRYGFYEALDFTPTRLPVESHVAIVRSFMAHHQGMTIVAIANTLLEGVFRQRFHQEPMIQACELLLQERMPRDVCISHPRAEEVKTFASSLTVIAPIVRRLSPTAAGSPITHLLSNGRYVVMLTSTGAGYSRWRDIAVTRWQEDTTCDHYGSFIFLRDKNTGQLWSSSAQPLQDEGYYPAGVFEEDHAEFVRHDGELTTTMDVLVSGEDDGEVRRISLSNNGRAAYDIELTSYLELVLTTPATDNAHPAFAKMFVQTEYVPEYNALIATRRKRAAQEPSIWAAHFAIVEGEVTADPQYETNRALFIGRGNSIDTAAAFDCDDSAVESVDLKNSIGTVLDPIFSLRYAVHVPAGSLVKVAFWTVVASSREELMDLIDRHHDRSAYDRAKTLAWTQAQVQLRHLGISPTEAGDFQRLAAPIIYADPRFRVSADAIHRGMAGQSVLWPHSISGDLPIVLLRIDDVEDIDQVKQLLRAHEYWRMKRLAVDLVIINEHACSYLQDLQIAIETAVRSSQSRPRLIDKSNGDHVQGAVYVLRADLVDVQVRDLLKSVARVVLIARRGSIGKHIHRLSPASTWPPKIRSKNESTGDNVIPFKAKNSTASDKLVALKQGLEFFNGLGGFGLDGREYTVILENGASTPAPWINVIANTSFGFHVSAEGSGYTWAENSRENQLTPWCNDPVSNPSGEAIYVRDEDSLELFGATAQPLRSINQANNKANPSAFVAHHGRGYSCFEHQADGLALTLLQYVPLADPIKISRLTLHNQTGRRRRFSVTSYAEWVLGTARGTSAPFITTDLDSAGSNALFVCNRWGVAFPGRVAFADMGGMQSTWTTDRTEFLGRNGRMNAPAALLRDSSLSGSIGAGQDPCTAQQSIVELEPDESVEVVILLGQCASVGKARNLIEQYRHADLDQVLADVTQYWDTLLGAVQVKTPDRAMDIMLNGWLLYQTVACRMWARSAFYQASGAYGFRDQLQDGMSMTFRRPDMTRAHILRAASRQFIEGDVQHWWLPHTGQGVRTHISDDRVWLAYATATYIETSGDVSILDEKIAFIEGPLLAADQHDAYFHPTESDESATLFEHCARGLDQCLELTGENGLPLMGTGDWNDGMNRVGEGGQGESVWLGWLLIRTINLFSPMAQIRDEDERVQNWVTHASKVREAIEEKAWDGDWYRRANFDDGSWLGSKDNDECQIDSIVQSWAVLSEAGEPERAAKAMESVEQYLIQPESKLALLFTPPFDKTSHDPGYIKGYPPGLRENGGQYSHAAMWAILAYAKLGDGNKASDLFNLLNPINHALNAEEVERYKVEPYVVAADVYSVAPHTGRGGWTWYTGSAGWMYRAGMEGILGIHREGKELTIQPCIPLGWPGFEATVKVDDTEYFITVEQSADRAHFSKTEDPIEDSLVRSGIRAVVDGMDIQITNNIVRVPLDGGTHKLNISYL
ncbi:GH36-type glycosyl hydrolase domain-containing protein [Marinomonas sp.]|uniref:GH36-type glycosyl hydrolase domain-containing protein n=1 Tax=Marinomonas sp. TaxID=1904862 RepID=UPI003A94E5E1